MRPSGKFNFAEEAGPPSPEKPEPPEDSPATGVDVAGLHLLAPLGAVCDRDFPDLVVNGVGQVNVPGGVQDERLGSVHQRRRGRPAVAGVAVAA